MKHWITILLTCLLLAIGSNNIDMSNSNIDIKINFKINEPRER
ncbi:Hypothetical protein F387_02037 [Wohlfahrtiimonas chitiniclastica SH04]|uniref:Uncharacterized protein n=1 Tax=Wohlfahrtiimonas chitiniclastica SH04 TaxID=1261130 RepID=L8XT21_9GAMM|nr:Hypothetical protein F387_02037 [Wohlfahrtiimonas chitiniclastica SH04]